MLRILGVCTMAVLFLMISPGLRDTVLTVVTDAVNGLDRYSPLSYVGLGAVCLGAFVVSLNRGSAPR